VNNHNIISASTVVLLATAAILLVPIGTSAFAQLIPPSQMQPQQGQGTATINGAGATFPFPLIDKWRVEYQKVQPNVNINYQSIGSGGGIKQFTAKTVDFGASDAPLSKNQTSGLPGPAVHIPETIGSVVVAYNIPEFSQKGLKLTGPIIADIYLGKISKWDDPQIKAINPGVPLPSQNINVFRRSDGSGTTFVFTSYLSSQSQEWKDKVGASTAVQWPVGRGANGNEGVANSVRGSAYSIAYVELAYALTTNMNYASIQNAAGNFIEPSLNSTKAAVESAAGTNLPAGDQSWSNVTLLNAPGNSSYPIASFTYLLVYKDLSTNINNMDKAKSLVNFINWAITDGQQFAPQLGYVPLPNSVVNIDQDTLGSLTYNGQPMLGSTTPQPTSQPQSFTVSSTFDGNNYSISGKSTVNAKVTSFTINPRQSVKIQVQGQGDIELTLPKNMIDGITTVMAGGQQVAFTKTSSDSASTTIKFIVPQNTDSAEIAGTTVVPEFGTIAVLVMAISIAAIIGYVRLVRSNSGLTVRRL
jgi:phosphate transport system permease protein/phosphate transport system substrate-binding protein